MALTETLIAIAAYFAISAVFSIAEYLYNRFIFSGSSLGNPTPVHVDSFEIYEVDQEYINASVAAVHNTIGESPVERLLAMNAQERLVAVDALANELKNVYGLENIDVQYNHENGSTLCGYFSNTDQKIVLYTCHLLTDNPVLVKDFLDTIFHEFRHAVQHRMLNQDAKSQYQWYNRDTIDQISNSLHHYISFSEDPRGYYYQYAEVDAREIAMTILEDLA